MLAIVRGWLTFSTLFEPVLLRQALHTDLSLPLGKESTRLVPLHKIHLYVLLPLSLTICPIHKVDKYISKKRRSKKRRSKKRRSKKRRSKKRRSKKRRSKKRRSKKRRSKKRRSERRRSKRRRSERKRTYLVDTDYRSHQYKQQVTIHSSRVRSVVSRSVW